MVLQWDDAWLWRRVLPSTFVSVVGAAMVFVMVSVMVFVMVSASAMELATS